MSSVRGSISAVTGLLVTVIITGMRMVSSARYKLDFKLISADAGVLDHFPHSRHVWFKLLRRWRFPAARNFSFTSMRNACASFLLPMALFEEAQKMARARFRLECQDGVRRSGQVNHVEVPDACHKKLLLLGARKRA